MTTMQGPGWTITKCHLPSDQHIKLPHPKPAHVVPFELFDDDDHLYFSGLMSEKLEDSHRIMDPLDANMGAYGVTYIHVRGKLV